MAQKHDDLANRIKANLDELEAFIEELDPGPARRRLRILGRQVHGALWLMKAAAVEHGLIQPFSGGNPDKPEDGNP